LLEPTGDILSTSCGCLIPSFKTLPNAFYVSSLKNSIQEKFSRLVNRQEISESKVLALDAEWVITCVCEHFRISREQLLTSKKGTENLLRDISIYLVRRFCCKTLPSVGREFGITNYSTVSSVIQRVKVRYESDKCLLKENEILKEKIMKGQKRNAPFTATPRFEVQDAVGLMCCNLNQ
jgi:REP-associated tyrosine transposase